MDCTTCGKTFTRREHLKRHSLTHREVRPFACRYCDKSFTRKDASIRHEQSHLPRTSNPQNEGSLRRTCSSCAKARVKCSGGRPCEFCVDRRAECIYSPRKRRRPLEVTCFGQVPPDSDSTSNTTPDSFRVSNDVGPLLGGVQPHGARHWNRDMELIDPGPPATGTLVGFGLGDPGSSQTEASVPASGQASFLPSRVTDSRGLPGNDIEEASMNWLPFESSPFQSTNVAVALPNAAIDSAYRPDDLSTSQFANTAMEVQATPIQLQTFTRSATQVDHVSSLIASMINSPSTVTSDNPADGGSALAGKLYADGAGSRWSQPERRAAIQTRASRMRISDVMDVSNSALKTLLTESIRVKGMSKSKHFRLLPEVYEELLAKSAALLTRNIHPIQIFDDVQSLLAIETWELFIHYYFEHFHPIYPFLDPSLLGLPRWGWVLCLATACLGARYVGATELVLYGELLSKVCFDILLEELELNQTNDSLPFVQARALCAVGLCQSRQRDLVDRGQTALTMVAHSCLRLRLLSEDERIGDLQSSRDAEKAWIAWRFRETRRRTGIFISTVVTNMAFIRVSIPSLNLGEVSLLLPSSDSLWLAETCQQWLQCQARREDFVLDPTQFQKEEAVRLSVHDVLRGLCVEGTLRTPLSAFATESIILTLIQRIWHAEHYLSDQLLQWSTLAPSSRYTDSADEDKRPYLGANPEFAKWRNATCDCLDILHWDALSVSAKAEGYESTAFLSLHLARLLLLAPVRELFQMQHISAGRPSTWVLPHTIYASGTESNEISHVVRVWFHQDRYKARLALLHAGAIFWHIRRYKAEAYTQPFAVFLATTILWAYATCAHSVSHQNDQSSASNWSEGEVSIQQMTGPSPPSHFAPDGLNSLPVDRRMPQQIQLDRPFDDELAQYFIRYGSKRINLEGISDLCTSQGAVEVLEEGLKIMEASLGTWTIAERYARSLYDMIRAAKP